MSDINNILMELLKRKQREAQQRQQVVSQRQSNSGLPTKNRSVINQSGNRQIVNKYDSVDNDLMSKLQERRRKQQEERNQLLNERRNRVILPVRRESTNTKINQNTNKTTTNNGKSNVTENDIEKLIRSMNSVNSNQKQIEQENFSKNIYNNPNPHIISNPQNVTKVDISDSKEDKPLLYDLFKVPEAFKDNLRRFDDGYQFGDILGTAGETVGDVGKTVGGTVADVGLGAIKGVANIGGQLADVGVGLTAEVIDLFGNKEVASKLRNSVARGDTHYASKQISEWQDAFDKYSVIAEKGDQTIENIGYMGALAATGGAGGKAGKALSNSLMFGSGAGSGIQEAYQNEVTGGKALLKGLGSGTLEMLTEKLFGFFGNADTKLVNNIVGKFKLGVSKALVRNQLNATGEITEEAISYTGNYLLNKLFNVFSKEGEAKLPENFDLEALGEEAGTVYLSSSIFGFGSSGGATLQNKTSINTWTDAINETVHQQEVNEQKEELREELDKLNKKIRNTKDLSQVQEMQNEMEWKQKQLNALVGRNNILLNLKDVITENNTQNYTRQQIIQKENKTAQNGLSEQINNIMNNKKLPMQSYQYEKSDNTKIDNLRQDASKYFINSEQAHNYVKMLEQIITDKGVEIRLDGNLKTADGKVANGAYSNGVITINPNSTRAGEFIAIHELTHAIGTKQMIDMVENYRKSNAEFDTAVKSLLQNYNETEITEEALSDVSAQLFGNQEFINNLSQNNPNLFQRIYNEIKYLWHQFRGYKNQSQFIEDLQYKWEKAYRRNKINIDNLTKYSFAGTNAKTANIENLKQALNLEEQGKNAQEIYEQTGWYRGNENKWRFEIDDSNFNIKSDIKLKKDSTYYLADILDAPELFEAYPRLETMQIKFKDLAEEYGGYYNGVEKTIVLRNNSIKENDDYRNNELLGLKNQHTVFYDLMHEIQHYIQDIEGFSRGSSVNQWIKEQMKNREKIDKRDAISKYFNTAGEQEARDVQKRTNMKSEDRKITMPFVKNKETVYAEKNQHAFSRKMGGYFPEIKINTTDISKYNIKDYENKVEVTNKILNNLKDTYLSTETQSKPIINIDTGMNIEIRQRGIRETFGNDKYYKNLPLEIKKAKIATMDSLAKLIKYGEVRNQEALNYHNPKSKVKYAYLTAPITIDGVQYNVNLDIRKSPNGENRFYIHSLNIKKGTNSFNSQSELLMNEISPINSISSSNKKVNTTTKYSIQESENNSWQEYLDKNFKSTGTRTNLEDIKLPTKEDIKTIENNQQSLYNNNESESDIDENNGRIKQDDKRRVQELFELYERGQTNGTTDSQELRRNQVEKTIGERELKIGLIKYADKHAKNNLTEKERKLKSIINKLGGDVVFYEYGNDNYYQGLANNEKFYIDTLGDSSIENVFYHELTHYLRQNNNKTYINEIQPIVNEIASDYDYQEAIFNYANSASEEFDVRNLNGNRQLELAEEVVADYVASFYGDLSVGYGLPNEIIQQVKTSMDKILNQKASDMESNDLTSLDINIQDDISVASNESISQKSGSINISLENKPMKDKARKYINRSKKRFINNIVDKFQTSYYSNKDILNETMDKLIDEIETKGAIDKNTASEIFEELYSKMIKIDETYYNEFKDVKNNIRKTKLYVPVDVRNSITDFNDFRQSNFGNLILTGDSNNVSIDAKYKELSSLYPSLFPESIVNPADQLERIAEIQKDITKTETNVGAYLDSTMGAEYKKWAKHDFMKVLDDFVEDVNLGFRYNNDTKANNNSVELNELKDMFDQLPYYQREYEKVSNKEVLTAKDRVQLDRLLKGEITLDELPKNSNVKGIKRVYEAKLPYQTLLDAIQENKAKLNNDRIAEAKELISNADSWKDKKIGFQYNRETAKRNIYDIMPKEDADRIYKKYFEPYSINEAQATRDINRYNDMINDLNIGTAKKYKIPTGTKVSESALVQMFGENRISLEELRSSGANVEKIENATKVFREIYDELFDRLNESSIKNGYNPIQKRKDYFPHFTEAKPDGLLSKLASKVGIDLTNQELPTDIAGITAQFKPGRKWMGNLLHRYSDITDFDVLKGFDNYVRNATDIIYHTEDIKNLRALNSAIRFNYSDSGIQDKINSIKEDSSLDELEKVAHIQELFENKDTTHLSKFVTWLNEYTNSIAGKKSMADRNWEYNLGRNIYNTMSNLEKRISANMIAGNVGVALTNVAPLVQAKGEISTINLANGLWKTLKNTIKKDSSFANSSSFITNRRGTDYLSQSNIDKFVQKITSPLSLVDDIISETIVRGKYYENIQNGMQQEEALQNADEFTSSLMADRSKGQLPIVFYNKNPISKLNTMFQVEVNNQWSYYFKDLPKNSSEGKFAKAKLVSAYTKIAIGSYLFNELVSSIRGGDNRVLPDIIHTVAELIKGFTDDEEDETTWETLKEAGLNVAGNVPFISFPAALLGIEDLGRIPVSGAVPNMANVGESVSGLINGDMSKDKAYDTLKKELSKPLYYVLPTAGGGQIKKTAEAVKTMRDGGSYSVDSEGNRVLQFSATDLSLGEKVKAGVFGKYALPMAKEYAERGYKTLNSKQTKLYEETKLPYKQLLDYIDAGLTKTEDKINYVKSQDMTENQKWGIYKYNILSSTEREDGSSQVSDADYIVRNGVSKSEYMNLYNKAVAKNVTMPTADEYKKMKNAGLSLSKYIDYNVKVKDTTAKRKKEGDLKENQSLKDADRIQILLDSNYSDKEIKAIYENYICNKNDSNYNIMKSTNIDIKEYLKYRQQNFESDKIDDGTVDGKTVSGSKKKKVYSYINSMKIDYNQRLLLLGQQYKLTTTERTKLANYVYSLDLTNAEKLDIYGKLEGFTVYKDGTVRW